VVHQGRRMAMPRRLHVISYDATRRASSYGTHYPADNSMRRDSGRPRMQPQLTRDTREVYATPPRPPPPPCNYRQTSAPLLFPTPQTKSLKRDQITRQSSNLTQQRLRSTRPPTAPRPLNAHLHSPRRRSPARNRTHTHLKQALTHSRTAAAHLWLEPVAGKERATPEATAGVHGT
jgi:hypothetical protein